MSDVQSVPTIGGRKGDAYTGSAAMTLGADLAGRQPDAVNLVVSAAGNVDFILQDGSTVTTYFPIGGFIAPFVAKRVTASGATVTSARAMFV